MSLPGILLPFGMPVFQSAGHSIALRSIYADVPFRTGHGRKRPIARSRPRVVQVGLFLTREQMAVFDDWFNDDLDVGTRQFSAQVANQGPGLLWWAAEWFDVPLCTPLHSGYWRVTGSLLLTGEGSVDGPEYTTATVEFLAPLTATAVAVLDGNAAVEFGAELTTVALAAVEFGAALETHAAEYLLLQSLSYIRRQDGGRFLRE